MPDRKNEEMEDLLEKYKKKIEKELGAETEEAPKRITTKEYQEFRKEFMLPHLTAYEKLCSLSEKILKVKPDKKREEILQEAISISHLNVTPTGVVSFSIITPILLILFGSLLSYMILRSMFFVFFFFLAGLLIIRPLGNLPEFIAAGIRMRASNQMVLCIFYVVTFMRHTSNLELAIEFSSEHLAPPLSLDLRKVLWDVETEKFSTVKESLEAYLGTWKKWNLEFIEAFHLIEGSLYEGSEEKRLSLLDKALDVILEETYEKMLHYAHNLKSPITTLHMMGIILPILGLVILPLMVSFMDSVKWFHIAIIYNVGLPIGVYFMGKNILSKRPTGYGDTDISEENPELKKYRNVLFRIGTKEIKVNPLWFSIFIAIIFFFIGISPIILHGLGMRDIGFGKEDKFESCVKQYCLLGYNDGDGPYGLGASLLSLAIIIGIGLSIGTYYKSRSKNLVKIREKGKQLEQEFASALFQLGNILGDGIPAEMAVGKVAEMMEGTISGSFFNLVSQNIRKLGMGVQRAIFDPKYGALVYFPSNLIESSMKVLIEGVKKGPVIAAHALMNVSRYIKEIHKVDERLKDLMAEEISSITSQINFLTPTIAAIVVGITSMIMAIIGKLTKQLGSLTAEGTTTAQAGIMDLFGKGIPTYYFQIIVGLYVVQVIYVLTILSNGVQNGSDKLGERYALGANMTRSTLIYCFISFAVILLFNLVASNILSQSIT